MKHVITSNKTSTDAFNINQAWTEEVSSVFEDRIKEIMQNTVRQRIVIDETEYSGLYCSINSPAQNSAA